MFLIDMFLITKACSDLGVHCNVHLQPKNDFHIQWHSTLFYKEPFIRNPHIEGRNIGGT